MSFVYQRLPRSDSDVTVTPPLITLMSSRIKRTRAKNDIEARSPSPQVLIRFAQIIIPFSSTTYGHTT